jgi:hypothetical protein
MTEPTQGPERDSKRVAHIGHVRDDAHLEDIHQHRLEREERRRNLKWMAIVVVLSFLAVGFALLFTNFWVAFETYVPGYEPKDQSRQQHFEQGERGRPKEAP